MATSHSDSPPPLADLRRIREEMGLTQAELAALLGFSVRAIQSVEQGWRHPSAALEKAALLLLLAEKHGPNFAKQQCWRVNACPPERRRNCISYRSRQGHLCWFLTGTLCGGRRLGNWEEKRAVCAVCPYFQQLLSASDTGPAPPGGELDDTTGR